MGKFKLAGKKSKAPPKQGAIPCLIIVILGIALISLLFYSMLKSA
jgi:hypothetical protein